MPSIEYISELHREIEQLRAENEELRQNLRLTKQALESCAMIYDIISKED